MKILARSLLSIATCVYIIIGMPGIALAFLLTSGGETMQGRLFGAAALLAFPVPVFLWLTLFFKQRLRLLATAAAFMFPALILLGACFSMTPDGQAIPGSCAESIFTGNVTYKRTSAANLVPEIDQLKLGTYVFPQLDPFIDAARAVRIRQLFLNVYREMQQSDEFIRLGSVLNYVYQDMFLGRRTGGHLYQYIPKTGRQESKLPVILFLHGSLGNFKGYLWVWKKFADEHGYAVVAPSFGEGNWYLSGGVEAVEQARLYCLAHPRMDGSRIYLAGLSNGGTGVTRSIAANGSAYAGFIFISPVIEDDIISTEQFRAGCKGRRMLVIHGAEDERIPASNVEQSINLMRTLNIPVSSKFFPAEDHFLLFSKPDEIRSDIATWLTQMTTDSR